MLTFLGWWALPEVVSTFFKDLVKTTIEHREKHNLFRNDLMQLMIELRKDPETSLSIEEIGGNLYIFFIAGADTSTSVVTYTLLELAKNPQVYEKVRQDVLETLKKHNNEYGYDSIQSMKYLNMCIRGKTKSLIFRIRDYDTRVLLSESLRMHPTLPTLSRVAMKDYMLPGTKLVVQKGTPVIGRCC